MLQKIYWHLCIDYNARGSLSSTSFDEIFKSIYLYQLHTYHSETDIIFSDKVISEIDSCYWHYFESFSCFGGVDFK